MIIDDAVLPDKEEQSSYATIPRVSAIHGSEALHCDESPLYRNELHRPKVVTSHGSLQPLLGWRKPVAGPRRHLVLYALLFTLSVLSFILGIVATQHRLVAHPVSHIVLPTVPAELELTFSSGNPGYRCSWTRSSGYVRQPFYPQSLSSSTHSSIATNGRCRSSASSRTLHTLYFMATSREWERRLHNHTHPGGCRNSSL